MPLTEGNDIMAKKIIIRSFRNTDYSQIFNVWENSTYHNTWGDFTSDDFYAQVLGSLLFDPEYFILAVEHDDTQKYHFGMDGTPVGFVHGGFAPNADRTGIDPSEGHIAMLVVREPSAERDLLPKEAEEWKNRIRQMLLTAIERKFAERGIRRVFAGADYPNAPFYYGLLKGGEPNGILENDECLCPLFKANGYVPVKHNVVFSATVDHMPGAIFILQNLMIYQESVKRPKLVQNVSWWDQCARASLSTERYTLIHVPNQKVLGSIMVTSRSDVRETNHYALHNLNILEPYRKLNYAKLFMNMLYRRLYSRYKRPFSVELTIPEENLAAQKTFRSTHFFMPNGKKKEFYEERYCVFQRELPEGFLKKGT